MATTNVAVVRSSSNWISWFRTLSCNSSICEHLSFYKGSGAQVVIEIGQRKCISLIHGNVSSNLSSTILTYGNTVEGKMVEICWPAPLTVTAY
jgi:hypothetical protein